MHGNSQDPEYPKQFLKNESAKIMQQGIVDSNMLEYFYIHMQEIESQPFPHTKYKN